MPESLKTSTLNAIGWSLIERLSNQGLNFIISIIIARILSPEDFGLVAMLTIFSAIGHSFINSGFGQALIQKKNATHEDECSIFYFNISVAILFTLILYISSPYIARFYNQPVLLNIARVLSFVFIINSLGLIQRTLLTKELDFKTQLKVSLIGSIFSGIVAIILAMLGFGVWSLVVMSLLNESLITLSLWYFRSWRPSFLFSITSLKSMYNFGSKLFIVSVTNSFFSNMYQLIIGKLFTPSDLGFYTRGMSISRYPTAIIQSVIGQVSFPVLSKIQNDKEQIKKLTQKAVKLAAFVTFPLMFGIIATSESIVTVLLTDKWFESVPYLQLLCIVGMLYPIQAVNLNALNAQGRSDLHLKVDSIYKILVIIMLLLTYKYGIIGIIIGQILNSIIAFYLYSYYSGKILYYSFIQQLKDLMPSFLLSFLMFLVVYAIKYAGIENIYFEFIVQMFLGVIVYTFLNYFFRIEEFLYVVKIYNKKMWV